MGVHCIVKLKLVECTNLISNYPTLIRIYCCIISNFNFSEHKSVQSWIFNLALTPCQSFQFAQDYASVEKFSNKKKNINNNMNISESRCWRPPSGSGSPTEEAAAAGEWRRELSKNISVCGSWLSTWSLHRNWWRK